MTMAHPMNPLHVEIRGTDGVNQQQTRRQNGESYMYEEDSPSNSTALDQMELGGRR